MWGVKLTFLALALLYAYFWWQESRPSGVLSPRGRASRRMCIIFLAVTLFLQLML